MKQHERLKPCGTLIQNQSLPSCTLIYATLSQVVGNFAAQLAANGYGGSLRSPFGTDFCPTGICQTETQLPQHRSGALCQGTQATALGFALCLWGSCCTSESGTITNLPHFAKCSWVGDNYPCHDTAPCCPKFVSSKGCCEEAARSVEAKPEREPCLRGGLGTAGSHAA